MQSHSVIIPCYNAQRFLGHAIDSALAQTIPATEIIVIDDGSTDESRNIAEAYGESVIVISERVGGAGPARNLAARRARGEWLAFLDADDVWLPSKLERQFASMPADAVMSCTDRYNVGDLDGLPAVQGSVQPLRDGDVFEYLLLHGNFITTSSVLLQRNVFMEIGGFPQERELAVAEDWDLWMHVLARHTLHVCSEPLVEYRLHTGGASRRLAQVMRARERVVQRALATPRGRELPLLTRQRIWAEIHRTNGWDAMRSGDRWLAAGRYARAIVAFPGCLSAYQGFARTALRLS